MPDFGNGVVFKIGTQTISHCTSVAMPSMEADTLDSTVHGATQYFRTFEKGLIDAGEIGVDLFFEFSDNYTYAFTALKTTSLQSITITAPSTPSNTRFSCNGHIVGLEGEMPHDDLMSISLTVKVSGVPVVELI